MDEREAILIGGTDAGPEFLALSRANRHGLIAGATGTGKTVTLQVMSEAFSRAGVPVFLADVKGDLAGLSQAGSHKDFLVKRAEEVGDDDYDYEPSPVVFWDLFGERGHPVRATVAEMGPLMLSRLLGLNDVQEGVLTVAFQLADDEGLLVLDLADLRSLLNFVHENASALGASYGHVSKASIGAIMRRLLQLERQGAEHFFGEPALRLSDLMRLDPSGRGTINVLAADRLMQTPKLYATFLLWMLSELFEELPEVGDPKKPKLVFFFDEAHLLFDGAPSALLEKIEQVVRLIRSKGVGVFFVTQNPLDLPDDVSGQLGARVQHALRAFTPRQKKAVRAAAETFRANPELDTVQAITQLEVGEALVSTLESSGAPSIAQRAKIRPPRSRMGPIDDDERRKALAASPFAGVYDEAVDRRSAHEILSERAEKAAAEAARDAQAEAAERLRRAEERAHSRRVGGGARPKSGRQRQGVGEAFAKSIARSVGGQVGRSLVRGLLGSFLRR